MTRVIEITDQNFEDEVLNSNLPTEVYFWAPGCGPCGIVARIYDKLSEEYEDRFKFCKINIAEFQQMATKYYVAGTPVQIFFINGEKVDEITGAFPEHTIREVIEGILQNYSPDKSDIAST